MRYLKLSALQACSAALAVTSSCNDMPAPLEPEPIELDLQVQLDAGSGEICWYVTASHPKYNRHVVSWQDAWSDDGFETDYKYRFGEPLPAGEYEDFFPGAPPLVAHVINLCKDGSQATADRVGNGYVVSVVEKEGKNNGSSSVSVRVA